MLWRADPTLTIALEASKTFVKRTEYLMMFWPSARKVSFRHSSFQADVHEFG